jgi:serine protease Do
VNIRGELVGINTAIATRSGSYQGIGFAIPINMAQRVMAALIEHGEVVRGWLGVMIQDIGEDLAQVLELSNRQGALVGEVVEDSPASEAGVEEGDVILEFDGSSVEDTNDLRNRVAATSPGKRAKLGVLRDGNRRTLTVAIGQLPAEYGGTQPRQPESRLGLVAQELTPDLAKLFRYKGKEGVLVSSVASGSPADDAGLRPGDIIREIDRATVEDVETYERLIREAEPGGTLLLLVRRTSGQLYLTLSVPEE